MANPIADAFGFPYWPVPGDKQVAAPGGGVMSELTTTVQDPRTGQWLNVPTLWMTKGGPVQIDSPDSALAAALRYESTASPGRYPRWSTLEQALTAAEARTRAGGTAAGPLASVPYKR